MRHPNENYCQLNNTESTSLRKKNPDQLEQVLHKTISGQMYLGP
jgi:hypothetical protein